MIVLAFLRRTQFVWLLVVAFLLVDYSLSLWNPMDSSRRFYKNDFTKTIFHHDGITTGPVFYGNSAVTGAYMEERAERPLTEMGMSYGKLTDLKAILQQSRYTVENDLVIGIDVHTMIDADQTVLGGPFTDPTYPWHKRWYEPYLYKYRDYFRDSGEEAAKQAFQSIRHWKPKEILNYQPRWIDKELYFGLKTAEQLQADWDRYEQLFGHLKLSDFQQNHDALAWIIQYARNHSIDLKVIWMPWNSVKPYPPYMSELKQAVNQLLGQQMVPVWDAMDQYGAADFHDLVHLNRETGAPKFTKEVDEWLQSFDE